MIDKKKPPELMSRYFRSVSKIQGPLIFIDHINHIAYNEMVTIIDSKGHQRTGRILEIDRDRCMVQVFAGTEGLDLERTQVRFLGDVGRLNVSRSMLGRILNGAGNPLDGGPEILPEQYLDLNGLPINPTLRVEPKEFIQTGISSIDGLNTLARGQKLPIFSAAGLPGNELAAQIATQAGVHGKMAEEFSVVFAAVGITHRESSYFLQQFRNSNALGRSVLFLNHADDPTIERILTPRAALTAAEYLAFQHDHHVLVILTDMTNYCEALREVSAAREEIPGRRGYPGYLYSDLASLYERAGRVRDSRGSITQIIVLSMPDDDITHPIPDLTGYITEGQIVLNRELHQSGVYPPIDVLPCLSRLMNSAIGEGRTRADHRSLADQLYAFYAEGRDLRRLVSIVGEGALTADDRRVLEFTDRFENEFLNQQQNHRTIDETLTLSWQLLERFPPQTLKRISQKHIEQYHLYKES